MDFKRDYPPFRASFYAAKTRQTNLTLTDSTQLHCSLNCTRSEQNGIRCQKSNPHTLNRSLWREGRQLQLFHQPDQLPSGNAVPSPQTFTRLLNSALGQTGEDFPTINCHVQLVGDPRFISPQLKNFPTFIVFLHHLNIPHMLLLKTLLTFKADTY